MIFCENEINESFLEESEANQSLMDSFSTIDQNLMEITERLSERHTEEFDLTDLRQIHESLNDAKNWSKLTTNKTPSCGANFSNISTT